MISTTCYMNQRLAPTVLGNLEGNDQVEGQIRLFLSCPDADALVKKLLPWVKTLSWGREIKLLKRYGEYSDPNCHEEYVEIR